MDNEFIPYEEALALKELGFNEPCLRFYTKLDVDNYKTKLCLGLSEDGDTNTKLDSFQVNYVSAPLYQQAFRWFREKYGQVAEIHGKFNVVGYWGNILFKSRQEVSNLGTFETYEEAELACLRKLIEIIKNK